MTALFESVVIVTRKTELDELIRRFNTRAQAKFYLEQGGHTMDGIEAAHDSYQRVLTDLRAALPSKLKQQVIDREQVPQFLFGEQDLVVTIGQDGLVSNTAKYLDGQPIFAINPDPARYDGVLLPFRAGAFEPQLRAALAGETDTRAVRLAEAVSSNNQSLLAFNDFFVGARSHVSARYDIAVGGRREHQSSSGVIVSTGAGSTGWLQSVYAGAAGIVTALGGRVTPPPDNGRLPWDSEKLVFSVREPFPSQITQVSLVHGYCSAESPLELVSHMGTNGIVFSDGVESDYIEFNAGTKVSIRPADRLARLIVGPGSESA
ncbi:MAG: hypothetical protein R3315_00150 [Woeseiaceae bacterium]|nr:hypothetical protein [Woeseiaceae bacterium]